jgi:hypothetical protein
MAILKNTTIDDTGNLTLPTGTTDQRPGSVTAGQFRYNTTTNRVETYSSTAAEWLPTTLTNVKASGGSVYDVTVESNTYRVHVFTNIGNSTFTVSRPGTVEYLIVAGGGGGGVCYGGGGGGGGVLAGSISLLPQSYTITVGGGGTNQVNVGGDGGQGANSSAFGLTAVGGGFGGGNCANAGGNGGSGGGGSGNGSTGGARGLGTSPQGNNGAVGQGVAGGGGGGAGSEGTRTIGGVGISSYISGSLQFYSGGGTGGQPSLTSGGLGGGGRGGTALASGVANGTPNTGGGGGGSIISGSGVSGIGGSGIVIIRYLLRSDSDTANELRVLSDGLVLDFDFSKLASYSGTGSIVTDSRQNSLTGTLINSTEFVDQRTQRQSYRLISNRSIDINNLELRQNWTYECWVNHTAVSGFAFLGQGPTANNQGLHVVFYDASNLRFGMYANDTDFNLVTATNTWYHYVFTYNHSSPFTKQLYRNGVAQTGTNVSGPAQYAGTGRLRLGTTYDAGITFANGNLAVAKLYYRILTPQEILNNFNVTRWRFGV